MKTLMLLAENLVPAVVSEREGMLKTWELEKSVCMLIIVEICLVNLNTSYS